MSSVGTGHAGSSRKRPRGRSPSLPSGEEENADVPVKDDGNESESDHDDHGEPESSREEEDNSEAEDDMLDAFIEAGTGKVQHVWAKEDLRGWDDLREQIKDDLASSKTRNMSLTQVNQLLILRNFATLRLKGLGRIAASRAIAQQWHEGEGVHFARRIRVLAHHYQHFEQLPEEKRGGDRGNSLLHNEQVQIASRTYLSSIEKGEVTPKLFRRALNEQILPMLGYQLKKGLSERTARRWLVKLGWRRTKLKKGVYMDGHERPDVVKYRQDDFLPKMASYERFMVQWIMEDTQTVRKDPELGPGEKRIIPLFQDESSLHAGEYKTNVWCGVPHSVVLQL